MVTHTVNQAFDELSAADGFQRQARSIATYLLIGALLALALGLALGGLNVWEQREQFERFGDGPSFRFYALNFFSVLSTWALISAVLFAGGVLVSALAWFQSALAEDFDDLYDAAGDVNEPDAESSQSSPADWSRPGEEL